MQLYTAKKTYIQYLGKIEWLSRVTLSIKAAYKLVTEIEAEDLEVSDTPGCIYKGSKIMER